MASSLGRISDSHRIYIRKKNNGSAPSFVSPPLSKKKKWLYWQLKNLGKIFSKLFHPGRGAAWIARLTGGQKAAGSIPVAPTFRRILLNTPFFFCQFDKSIFVSNLIMGVLLQEWKLSDSYLSINFWLISDFFFLYPACLSWRKCIFRLYYITLLSNRYFGKLY